MGKFEAEGLEQYKTTSTSNPFSQEWESEATLGTKPPISILFQKLIEMNFSKPDVKN